MPRRPQASLSPVEWAALALLAERPAHGFAIARAIEPDGEVGRVWSSSRPLVYRALATLIALDLIEERGTEKGERGPQRTVLAATNAGRRAVRRWLSEPVAHVRELRSALMLKLLFLSRRAQSSRALLESQRDVLATLVERLEGTMESAQGFERALYLWRLESARGALRFTDELLAEETASISGAAPASSRLP